MDVRVMQVTTGNRQDKRWETILGKRLRLFPTPLDKSGSDSVCQ